MLDHVLGYMDRPWKAFTVLLALGIGAGAWAFWEERDRLIRAWRTMGTPEAGLVRGEVSGVLKKVFQQTSVDVAGVWSIHLGLNAAYFEGGQLRDGKAWAFNPPRVPALMSMMPTERFVKLLSGQHYCHGVEGDHDLILERARAEGLRWVCVIPIDPPVLVGVLGLFWREEPGLVMEEAAVSAANELVSHLVTR